MIAFRAEFIADRDPDKSLHTLTGGLDASDKPSDNVSRQRQTKCDATRHCHCFDLRNPTQRDAIRGNRQAW